MPSRMLCIRVHEFGGVEAMALEELPRPAPGPGEVLVRVAAAGVGPWDAWIRSGKSVLPQPLPLILGSDLSGIVEDLGPDAGAWRPGDAVFGVTNQRFTGAYAEYAVAAGAMIAHKPEALSDVEAASVPVVAATAWQMVFDHGHVAAGQRVVVLGGAGNVGAYAVQLAKRAGAHVIATTPARHAEHLRALGADRVVDARAALREQVQDADVVIDTVGGDALAEGFAVLKPGGALVSAVAVPDPEEAARRRVRAAFLLVRVTTEVLSRIAALLVAGALRTDVGEVLPLAQARLAHEMLEGAPHRRGKIVLAVGR